MKEACQKGPQRLVLPTESKGAPQPVRLEWASAEPVGAGSTSRSAGDSHVSYDIVIREGLVVDGSGSVPVRADVAIRGDRIAAFGEV